jgi:hypothetical protein
MIEHHIDYEIRIRGGMSPKWADWFGDREVISEGDETCIILRNADHSALYGTLRLLGSFDCRILSIRSFEDGKPV